MFLIPAILRRGYWRLAVYLEMVVKFMILLRYSATSSGQRLFSDADAFRTPPMLPRVIPESWPEVNPCNTSPSPGSVTHLMGAIGVRGGGNVLWADLPPQSKNPVLPGRDFYSLLLV